MICLCILAFAETGRPCVLMGCDNAYTHVYRDKPDSQALKMLPSERPMGRRGKMMRRPWTTCSWPGRCWKWPASCTLPHSHQTPLRWQASLSWDLLECSVVRLQLQAALTLTTNLLLLHHCTCGRSCLPCLLAWSTKPLKVRSRL